MENLYFTVFFLKLYQIRFCVCLSLFLLAEFVIPLYNCYFPDFRGFCDFRVFDLAKKYMNRRELYEPSRYGFYEGETSSPIFIGNRK